MHIFSYFKVIFVFFILASCGGGGGGGAAPVAPVIPSATVTVTSGSSSVEVNSKVVITWSSTLASSCSASGAWSGTKAISGTEEVTIPQAGPNSFSLSCSGSEINSGAASLTIEGFRYFGGTVLDGYLRGSTVYIDTNSNSAMDSDEPSVTTDNSGSFSNLKYANGTLISEGGIDLDTGTALDDLQLTNKLSGFTDLKIVTPLTTIAASMGNPENINAVFGIDSSIDLSITDPIPRLGDSTYDNIYEKGNQITVMALSLQNAMNAINASTDNSKDYFASIGEEVEKAYAALATPGVVDIENPVFISAVVDNVSAKKASTLVATTTENIKTALSSVIPIIQVKALAATTTGIQNFAFNTLQTDIQSIAKGEASADLMTNYTSNITSYIADGQGISATELEIDISALVDTVALDEDISAEVSPLLNDSFLRGQSISLSLLSNPVSGAVTQSGNVFTYTPVENFNGSDSFTYTINQGTKFADGTINLTVNPVNDLPIITSAAAVTVSENLTGLMAITATDIDGDAFTYAVAGTDASSVSVDTDGVMTFNTAPDYETKTSYSISYSVSDGTETVSQALAISIKDENDIPPTISNLVTSIEIAENTTDVLTVSATDDQDVDLIYSLSGTDASAFSISSAGVLIFNSAPNFEVKTSYVLAVSVSDGINVTSADLSINITNANDVPVISGLTATYSMVEGNTLISDVLATTDEDADAITLSLSGSDASLFQITSSTTLEFKAAPSYASPADTNTDNVYEVTVNAADGTATTSFAVSITISSANLSVSGAIFSSRRYVMDSDLPNTDNHAFTANNSFGGAQAIINPSIVNGFVGTTTTAADVTIEDAFDVYSISTTSSMYANLDVTEYSAGVKDLDLLLYDSDFNALSFNYVSGSTEANETINLPNDGTFFLVVRPVVGASKYFLTVGQRMTSSSATPSFSYVKDEVLSYIPFTKAAKAGKAHESNDSPSIDPKQKERLNRLSGFHHLEPLDPGLRTLQPEALITQYENTISAALLKGGFQVPESKMLRYLAHTKVINALKESNPESSFDFNYKVEATTAFSEDPMFKKYQWNMRQIGLRQALDASGQELKSVGVAVLDSGGPSVNSAAWNSTNFISGGMDFISEDADPTDPTAAADRLVDLKTDVSHGTHVATTIGFKNDGAGFNGFPVSVLNVRVLGEGASARTAINGILYSAGLDNNSGELAPTDIPIKVINMSLSLKNGGYSSLLCDAIVDARAQGIAIVAAAGNNQRETPGRVSYPASCPGVISVAATNSANNITSYSQQNIHVDIAAPGGDHVDRDGNGFDDLVPAYVGNSIVWGLQGTSMAAPHVSGAIAMLFAADDSMTPTRVDSMIQSEKLTTDLGVTGRDNVFGYGLLNLPKMLEKLAEDNSDISYTFATTDLSYLDFGNTVTQLNISLNKIGSGDLTVSSLAADSATGLSYTDNSSEGFGSYALYIDRDSMANGEFSNTLYFNLSDSTKVAVPIYYSVGELRTRAYLGKLFISLKNDSEVTVASGTLDMQSNGTLGFIASDLPNGNYYIYASTDIDADNYGCSYGEMCQYYPSSSSESDYFKLDGLNIEGYELSIGPFFKYGGINAASFNESEDSQVIQGIPLVSSANKILPIDLKQTKPSNAFGEKKIIINQ